MKKILFVLVMLPLFTLAQKTYVPDNAFEQVLINLDLDDIFDDSVYTSAIDTVTILYLSNYGITNLIGIEDFALLSELLCNGNQITALDLSNNANLFELNCNNNFLTTLDVRNGNNTGLLYFTAVNNPQLYCIAVNDIAYANANWVKDSGCAFSTNCSSSSIKNYTSNKKLIKVLDVFGRSVIPQPNITLFYIYDDGTVEKKIAIQ
jgi:hypothetical protein